MRAADSLDSHAGQAERALLSRRRGGGRWLVLSFELVDIAHHDKDHQGHDEETNDRVDEHAIVDGDGPRCLGFGQRSIRPGRVALFQQSVQVAKSTPPNSKPMGGMMTSETSDLMMAPKAEPMMMPIAMSITLPLAMNSLNS